MGSFLFSKSYSTKWVVTVTLNTVTMTTTMENQSLSAARKHAVTVLSVIGDASHNFTDGLTVAASYLVSKEMGMIQSFSILLHEIPHEIGDYAILIENGVSF